MEHQSISPEVTVHHHHQSDAEFRRRVRKTTIYLSVITIIELCFGITMYATDFPHWVDLFIKGLIVILTFAKAFYIVSIFMHLGDEIRKAPKVNASLIKKYHIISFPYSRLKGLFPPLHQFVFATAVAIMSL